MITCPHCKAENPDGNAFCQNCGKSLTAPPQNAAPTAAAVDLSGLQTISGDDTQVRGWRQGSDDTALEPGTVFADRYTVESLIGRGGMGMVYRAKDSIGDRLVALKLIRPDLIGGEPAVKRLIAEGVLTQDIRHKNVVNVYNVGQVDGQPFVAMEFAQGKSLREWLRQQVTARTEVPLRVAARIIAEILDGLDAAHAMGIVHRDLKPENVMLTADPSDKEAPLKILDFGIARAAGKMESGTGAGLGTPRYMAPEQITNPDSAGPSADLYSVSVMFYELLVDVLPQGHWQPPSGGRADVSPRIDNLIERGLANRPASRPQTAKEYRQQLVDAVNNGAPATASRPTALFDGSSSTASVPLFKRPWFKWAAIAIGVIAIISGISEIIGANKDGSSTQTNIVTPPSAPNYQALSGRWNDDLGGFFQVSVAPDGTFNGSGLNPNGVPTQTVGQFNGYTVRYTLTIQGLGQLQGGGQWDGECHINFTTYNPDGSINLQGKLHINHRPNEPCP